jgi:hypothetical protein
MHWCGCNPNQGAVLELGATGNGRRSSQVVTTLEWFEAAPVESEE